MSHEDGFVDWIRLAMWRTRVKPIRTHIQIDRIFNQNVWLHTYITLQSSFEIAAWGNIENVIDGTPGRMSIFLL